MVMGYPMLDELDLSALMLTLKLASVTTLILLVICTPIAWWLANSKWRYKFVFEALLALPLILPPTVLGFYLLLFLGVNGPLAWNGNGLAFSFTGLVIGSLVYSFPFVVQPLQNAFMAIGRRPIEVASTLGASPLDTLWNVILPLAKPGILSAAVLGFAHTLGEFGVVLMIGGNIPGETQVVSIAIYEHVESIQYAQAHTLSALLLVLSFVMLLAVYGLNRHSRMRLS